MVTDRGHAHARGGGDVAHGDPRPALFLQAAPGSREQLAITRGFTTFVLEASWSTGLRLDTYLTRGLGDPEQIMREEFQGQYVFWDTDEYLDLSRTVRATAEPVGGLALTCRCAERPRAAPP
ncbi:MULTISPECIES: erythromycin esterase family protein [Streptomyces violaceoruber group]|uniref:erythromycin esterase family protein n=1 Tax=Streptomyces violaceoruber group TaxID=2867121 RepID=UPI002AD32BC6|nr:erythromycin esterase family protein [Streptomyces anthocyanicus]